MKTIHPQLIIALDYAEKEAARLLISQLDPDSCILKVGLSMYTRYGSLWVQELVQQGFKVFLDLKFHDIPNTVAEACKAAADLGIWMLNIHALGGLSMMQAAKHALDAFGKDKPLLIAVTILTSMDETTLSQLGFQEHSIQQKVIQLAAMAKMADLDGVVCSAQEAATIKQLCGDSFLTITPGIRLAEEKKHDQARWMTPLDAIRNGSDFLVMGRAITQVDNPKKRIQDILKLIHS